MNYGKAALGGSVSILIGVVIAILALIRGKWEIPLLLTVFTIWGVWIVCRLLLPTLRLNRAYRESARQGRKEQAALTAAGIANPGLAQTLLRHVNYRVSAALKSAYPDAHWEWTMENPAIFAAQGGTGRIRVYGVPDFDFADVSIDQSGNLSCSLVKIAPIVGAEAPEASAPNAQQFSPQAWYELRAKNVLERLVADLNSMGHSRLYLKENGEICIRPVAGGEDVPQSMLQDFPARVYWPKLIEVLTNAGLTATQLENCIQLSW